MSPSLRLRLGPFPNELDAVRSLHRRQDVATPDDHVDSICVTCYILDEGWPCTVARLIDVIDAQIADEALASAALSLDMHKPGESHQYELTCKVCGRSGQVNVSVEPQRVDRHLEWVADDQFSPYDQRAGLHLEWVEDAP